MKILPVVLAAASIGMAANAHAATFVTEPVAYDGSSGTFGVADVSGPFGYAFDFSNLSSGVYDVTLSTASAGLKFTTMTFDGVALDEHTSFGNTSFYGLTGIDAAAGTQVIDVGGTGNGSFDGTVSFTSAAPEPSTWALMLAGVGGVGLALRYGRRNKPSDKGLDLAYT